MTFLYSLHSLFTTAFSTSWLLFDDLGYVEMINRKWTSFILAKLVHVLNALIIIIIIIDLSGLNS